MASEFEALLAEAVEKSLAASRLSRDLAIANYWAGKARNALDEYNRNHSESPMHALTYGEFWEWFQSKVDQARVAARGEGE